MPRSHRTPAALVGLVLASTALTGCGASGTAGGSATGSASTAPATPSASTAAPSGPTSLTVTSTAESGTSTSWTLTCDPVGGDHPDAAAACTTLAGVDPSVFRPVPADQACTAIYGGPQTATVTGTWRGTTVDAGFKRTDGCEIARWEALVPVLPKPGG